MKRRPKLVLSAGDDVEKKPPPGFESILPTAPVDVPESSEESHGEKQATAGPESAASSPVAAPAERLVEPEVEILPPSAAESMEAGATPASPDPLAETDVETDSTTDKVSPASSQAAVPPPPAAQAKDESEAAPASATTPSETASVTTEKRRVRAAPGAVFRPTGPVAGKAGGVPADQLERPSARQIVTTLLVVAAAALSVYLLKRRFF